jgi:hypothetical protein
VRDLRESRGLIRGVPRDAFVPEIQVYSFCGSGRRLSPVGALWMNALLP